MGRYVSVAAVSELPPGSMKGVDVEGKRILLTNLDGNVYAVSAICTHEYTDLSAGFMIEDRVVCALHLSQFDLRDGRVYNPPAEKPLETFNVKIEEGQIFVEV